MLHISTVVLNQGASALVRALKCSIGGVILINNEGRQSEIEKG
jgi:hypothetical protein